MWRIEFLNYVEDYIIIHANQSSYVLEEETDMILIVVSI